MALSALQSISDQDIRNTTLNKGGEKLGQYARTADGRIYVYAANQSTTTTLLPGQLTQGPTAVTNHTNQTGVTVTAGTNSVVYTIGNTAITANQYVDGYLQVNTGTGPSQSLVIQSHNTPAGNGSLSSTLKDAFYVTTAAASSKFSLVANPYSNSVIASHTTSTAVLPAGVPTITIPVATTANPFVYYWSQLGGPSATLINGTPSVGVGVVPSATTDGALDVEGTSAVQPRIGYMLNTGVSTQYYPVMLTLSY